MPSTLSVGAISEARFVLEALKRGWETCKPVHYNKAPYDFLLRKAPHLPWVSVQVKTAGYEFDKKSNRYNLKVKFMRTGTHPGSKRRYEKGDFDWLFVVTEKWCWLIPWKEIETLSKLSLQGRKYNRWLLK